MAIQIAMFNNKGGVSKTTTTFSLGWMLAERGHHVVIVDGDPQCNLTGMILDDGSGETIESYYTDGNRQNIFSALQPAFESRPRPVEAVDCVQVEQRNGLYLLPGHVRLAEYEVSLGIAQQLSETLQPLKNLPGSFRYLFNQTAERYGADYVIVDLSPGLGAVNQNIVMTSDYFIVPMSPDIFSLMAIDSLARVLPRWYDWAERASKLEALKEADYPFEEPDLKFLGTIVQRYRLRQGAPTEAFGKFFDQLDEAVEDRLVPPLDQVGMGMDDDGLDTDDIYEEARSRRLVSIPDFNTLVAHAQRSRKPVFALEGRDTRYQGSVKSEQESKIQDFHEIYSTLSRRVEMLTGSHL